MSDSKEGVLEDVPGLEGQKVVHIAAGAEHSALVTGMLFITIAIAVGYKFCYFSLSHVTVSALL